MFIWICDCEKNWYIKKYGSDVNDIKRIEILLETPISDYTKNAISLILAPYLINIKKLPYTNAFDIIKDWLNKCDSLRRLDSNFNYSIKLALEDAMQKGIPPMSLARREKKIELYDMLSRKMNSSDFSSIEAWIIWTYVWLIIFSLKNGAETNY